MAAGAISGLHARLTIPSSRTRKRTENDNDRSPPGHYHCAEPATWWLSPHWKSPAFHLRALQNAAQRYFVSMTKCEKMCTYNSRRK